MSSDILADFFDGAEFVDTNLAGTASPDNLFSIFESFDELIPPMATPLLEETTSTKKAPLVSQKSTSSLSAFSMESDDHETDQLFEAFSPKCKKQKLVATATTTSSDEANLDGQQKMSHITVERNRRKQMNEHLSVLRSLMPCFYVKRGDQASIIGGVVDYINELQQVLQSLEAKKQRKVYSEVLSPRLVSSPRLSPPILSPRKPPLSPRLNLPISPRTPQQPSSPYKPPRLQQLGANYYAPPNSSSSSSTNISTTTTTTTSIDIIVNNELVAANSKSTIADVEVKFSGPNVLLKTVSPRIHGQAMKIISTLEDLSLEILHVSVSNIDNTMINSFTIKIGIECQLSAEELAHQIQQTFC